MEVRPLESYRARLLRAAGISALIAGLLVAFLPHVEAQPAAGTIAAATESDLATREAVRQMADGGNAVDAAIAAALVGGVTSPVSSGIGGGGFAVVWIAAERKAVALDFREKAPQRMDPNALEAPLTPAERGRLVGVPGEVVGLYELSRRFGKRKWRDLVAPAARLAKSGFPISAHLANALASAREDLMRDPVLTSVFYPGGKPALAGKLVRNGKLGATLEKIASTGPNAFTHGPVAQDLAQSASALGGALAESDIAAYRPVERAPLKVSWEGYDVYTMPPPSAGGMLLAQTLLMYSRAELRRLGRASGAYQHMLAEAFRGAIADRMRYLGDPDVQPISMEKLLAPARLAARKGSIALDRTHALARFVLAGGGTHQIATADAEGNAVSLTTTVNRAFGAKLAAAESGVVLNDELDDFTRKKDIEPFGISESPNRTRPGARPVSSMTPTLVVRDGRVVLALGGSGGTAIGTNVTQMLLAHLAFDESPRDALASRRFYVPTNGATILLEPGYDKELERDLAWRGEIVDTTRVLITAVHMIAIENGRKVAAADPRKHGVALVR